MGFTLLPRRSRTGIARAGCQYAPVKPQLEILEDRLLPSLTPHLLKDIAPGAVSSSPNDFTPVGAIAYFEAADGAHGAELWRSNGTSAGTILVKDINHGLGSSVPTYLTNVNGTLFFVANDGTHGS